ncbi:nuclear transport factor 2 family protein [Niveispirillum sp. SYP-B3756]|uniref:YybH family protein n=1 Tax=Niveispirillum sp. SYP-B3756 TaxID=2662178 RepID=UPI001B3B4986
MIGSIITAWKSAGRRDVAALSAVDGEEQGLTRSNFLRAVTAGVLSAGVVASAGRALAARSSAIAPVADLDKLYDVWQARFNAADLDGLVDLYVSDVTYVNPDGKEMVGQARVREDFQGLLALKPQIVLRDRRHLVYRDTALTTNHWTLTMKGENGTSQELTGGGIEVMRKQADGGWRYIIDDASRSAT